MSTLQTTPPSPAKLKRPSSWRCAPRHPPFHGSHMIDSFHLCSLAARTASLPVQQAGAQRSQRLGRQAASEQYRRGRLLRLVHHRPFPRDGSHPQHTACVVSHPPRRGNRAATAGRVPPEGAGHGGECKPCAAAPLRKSVRNSHSPGSAAEPRCVRILPEHATPTGSHGDPQTV